jgi:hypothetical protein
VRLRKRIAKIVGVSVLLLFMLCGALGMLVTVIQEWQQHPVAVPATIMTALVVLAGAAVLLDWAARP